MLHIPNQDIMVAAQVQETLRRIPIEPYPDIALQIFQPVD
jgi:hypothetical protein